MIRHRFSLLQMEKVREKAFILQLEKGERKKKKRKEKEKEQGKRKRKNIMCRFLEKEAVTTLEILSRVFLFYFEKISVFWDVSVNTDRNSTFGRHEACA